MRKSKNIYVVLTGDLKASTKQKNRAEIQERLKKSVVIVNKLFKDVITVDFIVIGGDGFQGMISSLEKFLDIYYKFVENIGYQFYVGIGIGSISTSLSKNVGEIDGDAFYKSSKSLNKAKKEKNWIAFKSGGWGDNIITSSLNLMADVIWNWSKKQRDTILYYRNQKKEGAIKLTAKNFGVGERSIYKTLRRGKYHLLKQMEDALKEIMNQKWFKSNIEPPKGQ